jgi:glycosyltransferase involved in cell wall biosynthesis
MKILQIHNKVPYPPKDGGSIAVYNLSEGFAKLASKVDILALNTNKHFADIQAVNEQLPEGIKIHAFDINTDIHLYKLLLNFFFSKQPYNAVRFINKEFGYKLVELLKEKKYDVIQIEGLYMLPYLDIIRSFSKAIVAYRAHNIEYEIWQRTYHNEKSFIKRNYLKVLYKRIKRFESSYLNTYDVLIPITQRDADNLNKLGNTKPYFVSPTGITIKADLQLPEEYNPNKLFHLGSMDWHPNQEGLVWFLENVWKKVIEKNPQLTFTLAGRNAPRDFVKKISSYKNVVFEGEVESAADFMNNHSIMIVPLLSGSGMRIKLIEGMAHGKVIITTTLGAEGIPAKDMREILIADTADEFIKKIYYILEHPEKLKKISLEAKSFISNNFDNFAISKSLLDFYKEQIKK